MYVKNVDIKGFGRIRAVSIDFSRGLNLVYGDNESGKSTLQLFIKAMLFGLKGGRADKEGTPSPQKRFRPWAGDDYAGFMDYVLDSGEAFKVARNFGSGSVRVYDSLFHDITGTFETARDRNVLFAEKQLGLNESCFERTVYIRQMGTSFQGDGNGELLSRLVNAGQTGFEQISLNRAIEALRKALIEQVGTGKSSTRPLDLLNVRIDELKKLKTGYLQKREHYAGTQSRYQQALRNKLELEAVLELIEALKRLGEAEQQQTEAERSAEGLRKILRDMEAVLEELNQVKHRIEEFNTAREKLHRFSLYYEKDADNILKGFEKYRFYREEEERLAKEAEKRQSALIKARLKPGPFRVPDGQGQDLQERILELNRRLQACRESHFTGGYPEAGRDEASRRAKRLYTRLGMVSGAVALIFLLQSKFGFTGHITSGASKGIFLLTGALALLFLLQSYLKHRRGTGGKSSTGLNGAGRLEEITRLQQELGSLLKSVGAVDIEQFFLIKAEADAGYNSLCVLEEEIAELQKLRSQNRELFRQLFRSLETKLAAVGIGPVKEGEIQEEAIEAFRKGIREYARIGPALEYAAAREEDLEGRLSALCGEAAGLCGEPIYSPAEIKACFPELEDRIRVSAEEAAACRKDIEGRLADLPGGYLSTPPERLLTSHYRDILPACRELSVGLEEKLGEVRLEIRECEVLLQEGPEEEDIQVVEEEMEALLEKRKELEELAFSLNTSIELLSEAGQELQREFAPALNSRMSEIITRLTGGRYSSLKADRDLLLKTVSPESGDIVSSRVLSGGTEDQLYLAFRIASAGLMSGSRETLPLIMDEVFSQYDDSRTLETLEFLKALSASRQIVLFTCKSRELELVREVWKEDANITVLPTPGYARQA